MKTELRLIQNTGSPSGKYAVAWGVPGVSRLDQFVGAGGLLNTFPYNKLRNYLVEKRTLNIAGVVPLHTRKSRAGLNGVLYPPGTIYTYKYGGNDWHAMGGNGRNHSNVATYWNLSEQWAVILHSGKWWYEALYLCHKQDRAFQFVEIGDRVEDYVRAYLLRTRRAAYIAAHRVDDRNPYVDVTSVRVAPPLIILGVEAGIPKAERDPLGLSATLTLKIHTHRGGFAASPVDLRVKR